MELKRKNIKIGLFVAGIALVIFMVFLLVDTKVLVNIGNGIERIFGYCSNFDVEMFREGIKTISSGIFVSALVAVLFYFQEYIKMKDELIGGIIAIGRDICKFFDSIPAFYIGDEEAVLKKDYYLESKENSSLGDVISKIKELCQKAGQNEGKKAEAFVAEAEEKIKLLEERISNQAGVKLKDYWLSQGKSAEIIDEKMMFLVDEYDQLICKSLNCYRDILNLDLWRLRDMVNNLHSEKPISQKNRELIQSTIKDDYILGELSKKAYTEKDLAERVLIIFEKAIKRVGYTFDKNCVDIENVSNVNAIDSIMELQSSFVDKTEYAYAYGGKDYKPIGKPLADYEVMKYHMENLFGILAYGKNGKYKYISKDKFIRPAKRYCRGTFLTTVNLSGEEALDMLNIYR